MIQGKNAGHGSGGACSAVLCFGFTNTGASCIFGAKIIIVQPLSREVPAVLKSKLLSAACIRHDSPRHGRSYKTGPGCPLRASHSPEDLSGLPPLFEAVAGQGYHYRWMRSWRGCLPRHPLGRMGTARHLLRRFYEKPKEKGL